MSDGREERPAADFEAVADWFRHEQPEIGEPDLDRIKQRSMAQARRRPSATRWLPASLAGGLSRTKGALMGMRPRPFMTLFLALGLVGVVSVSTLFATEQLPGLGGFDAAQSQYDDDDDDGDSNSNNQSDDDDDGDGARPSGLPTPSDPVEARRIAGIECGIFNQNFVRDNTVGQCTAAGANALANPTTSSLAICQQAGFSGRRSSGFARSDLAACQIAVDRARLRFFRGIF
jgi:hypothetical protein